MERKDKRKKELKLRKNFFPTLILISILWTTIFGVIFLLDPASSGAIPLFLLLVFITLTFTSAVVFANTRRGVFAALGITFFLILRYLGIGNVLNILLLAALLITVEVYFSKY